MAKLSVLQLLRLKDPSLSKDSATALVSCRNVYVNGELFRSIPFSDLT